jgi:hypothetical protein
MLRPGVRLAVLELVVIALRENPVADKVDYGSQGQSNRSAFITRKSTEG